MAWAKNYERCEQCGTTSKKHGAKGLCIPCYSAQYNATHIEQVKQIKRNWWLKMGGNAYSKIKREERYYDGLREAALERDGHKCTNCGATEKLVVHHRDRNGRGKPAPNNTLENLQTLCRACHARIHGLIERWAKHFDKCQGCGTTARRHNAKGLCWKCYLAK